MKFWKLTASCAIGVFPLVSRAQEATTRPAEAAAPTEARSGGYSGRYGGYGYRRMFDQQMPLPGEWDEVTSFMKDHSPERVKAINGLPEGATRRNQLMMALTRSYRNIWRLKVDQPELADVVTNRVELEDQIFKLTNQIRFEKGRGDSRAQADRKLLQEKMGELLDSNIKERQMRIARLESTLDAEKKQLAADAKNRDQLIDRRVRTFIDGPKAEASVQDPRDQGAGAATQP